MPLSKHEIAVWRKAQRSGAGGQAVQLTPGMCGYLLSLIVADLGLTGFTEMPKRVPGLYEAKGVGEVEVSLPNPLQMYERLVRAEGDIVTYFGCLAALLRARLKYGRILSTQPFPTLDQVGPRGLLQYGDLSPAALTAFMFWRKWFFDIDNRAGQETGYLFEPVIAASVGGVPYSATKSPVKSHRDGTGRQVDCLLDRDAYEVKLRVTIAASGQGRWGEEMDFPVDCKASGFRPILLVLDGTANDKLDALIKAFQRHGGEVHVGDDSWRHLEGLAGAVMGRFLDKYVRKPLNELLAKTTTLPLPEFSARDNGDSVTLTLLGEVLTIERHVEPTSENGDELPEDVGSQLPNAPE